MAKGSLVVVGTGIQLAAHLTLEARAFIEQSEKVCFLVNEPVMARWLQELNPSAESLGYLYAEGKLRLRTYREIITRILITVRQGVQVCAVFYGHPGVFVTPAHAVIHLARQEGFRAIMLPGVSAEDCLFADLGLDPAHHGCQSYEATEFLLRRRAADVTTPLILWQVGVVGELTLPPRGGRPRGLSILCEVLQEAYGPEHPVILYEASRYAGFPPRVERFPLAQLANTPLTPVSTLYVPPRTVLPWDKEMMVRLGITEADLEWSKGGE
ncbi:MAG: SAM-dependent methyltransferase [Chloroflexota bacterium]